MKSQRIDHASEKQTWAWCHQMAILYAVSCVVSKLLFYLFLSLGICNLLRAITRPCWAKAIKQFELLSPVSHLLPFHRGATLASLLWHRQAQQQCWLWQRRPLRWARESSKENTDRRHRCQRVNLFWCRGLMTLKRSAIGIQCSVVFFFFFFWIQVYMFG